MAREVGVTRNVLMAGYVLVTWDMLVAGRWVRSSLA